MQNSSQDRDTDLLLSHYKSISFKACTLSLFDRSPQGKTIGIRSQSMLPQITIPIPILQSLSNSSKTSKIGLFPTSKLSPTHYLSLAGEMCYWPEDIASPLCDFLIYLRETPTGRLADHLYHDEKILDTFYQQIQEICSHSHSTIEVLNLCRSLILYSTDSYAKKLFLRCEILFPHTNLLFVPLNSLKLVSCPLTKKLIQKELHFSRGYLTMDQSSRVVPLETCDPMVIRYPIVGIWVKGIPQTNSAVKSVNLVHPLVWSACLQFILHQDFREKVSPNPSNCSFLFVDFSEKVKFYEVSCQKPPAWKTTSFSAEVSLDTEKTANLQVQFLKKDTRFLIKNTLAGIYESVTSIGTRSTTPPTAKPPTCKSRRAGGKEMIRTKSYEKIIGEQTKLIEKLQAKVQKLQLQVSPKSRSYTEPSDHSDSFKNSIETNTTVSLPKEGKSHKKLNFEVDEQVISDKPVYCSQKLLKPMTAQAVPRINYCSSSDSSEEENVIVLQKIYLSKHRK